MSASVTRCLEQNVASILLKDAKFCRHIKKQFFKPQNIYIKPIMFGDFVGEKKLPKLAENRQNGYKSPNLVTVWISIAWLCSFAVAVKARYIQKLL